MIDYHVHTPLCRHATGTPEQHVAEARRLGLAEIGFADHFPLGMLDYTPRVQVTMNPEELDGYVEKVRHLAASGDGIAVKLGIEVDYLPGKDKELRELLARYPFDYLIGSIHFLDGWDFTHPVYAADYASRNLSILYRRYFELVRRACASSLFDIIGHVDVIKKFGYQPGEDLEPYWRETARILRETGTCLELNTAGRDAPAGSFYPGRRFLEICCSEGVPVTLGSDAHGPEQVGRHFTDGVAMLKEAGYRELVSFTGRRRSTLLLGG